MVALSVRPVNGPRDMKRSTFYGKCLWRALASGYAWASLASLAITIICGYLAYANPRWGTDVTILVWLVPFCVLLVTAIVAWTLAPYAMYRELETAGESRIEELLTEHRKAIARSEELHATAIAERDEVRAACEDLKKPKKTRGDRNDVIRRFQRIVDAGKKITPERWSDFKTWESQMIPVVQECLEEHWANEIIQPGQDMLRIQSPNEKEKAKCWLTATIAKVQGWIGALRDGKVDHCIRADFYVEIQS
jgi:hypothetical protein